MPFLNGEIEIGGDHPPTPEVLDAYAAEIRRRVDADPACHPGFLYHPRVHPRNVDLTARNAARVVLEIRRRGTAAAKARADLETFAAPFLRGFLTFIAENADNIHIARQIEAVTARLVDVMADLSDPEWEPA